MAIPAIDNFLATLNTLGGVAERSRFNAIIMPPNMSLLMGAGAAPLAMLCEAAELPGQNFATTTYRTYGPTKQKAQLAKYQDIDLTFICTNSFMERRFFDSWLRMIQPKSTWDTQYKSKYATTVIINQFSPYADIPIYTVMLKNAFPISMNPQEVSWGSKTFHTLKVDLAYDYWTTADEEIAGLLSKVGDAIGNMFDGATEMFSDGPAKDSITDPLQGGTAPIGEVTREDLPPLDPAHANATDHGYYNQNDVGRNFTVDSFRQSQQYSNGGILSP